MDKADNTKPYHTDCCYKPEIIAYTKVPLSFYKLNLLIRCTLINACTKQNIPLVLYEGCFVNITNLLIVWKVLF